MLLLTDRLTQALALQEVLGTVETCAVLVPGQGPEPEPTATHAAVLCDVSLDSPAACAATQAVLARHRAGPKVPLLYLSRTGGGAALTRAQAIGATAVLPRDASDAQILFTVRRLIEAGRPADAAVAASIREAAAAFTEIFDASRHGKPLAAASLDRGGSAVIMAVGQGRIGAWLDLVRAYDDLTYQHCLLVAGLAAAFSARLGLSLGSQRLITQAALVHDIGKASIPYAILNKPGRLSPGEVTVMRTHPTVGHDLLLRQGGFDPQILDIVRHHHEYLDGSGYPDGLRGERVSPLVRLVTICDIFAALIERRSYKAPMPPETALRMLAGMGSKLDPGLVGAFRGVAGGG